jgi:hypothetical protein
MAWKNQTLIWGISWNLIVITSVHSYKKIIFPLMKSSVVAVFSHVFPVQLHWKLDASQVSSLKNVRA